MARFIPTDRCELHAGSIEDSFVLIAELESVTLDPTSLLRIEPSIGASVARMHLHLASYPDPANSYEETMLTTLQHPLNLPEVLRHTFRPLRDETASSLTELPRQLIHGDLTPENIILSAEGRVSGFIDFEHLPVGP